MRSAPLAAEIDRRGRRSCQRVILGPCRPKTARRPEWRTTGSRNGAPRRGSVPPAEMSPCNALATGWRARPTAKPTAPPEDGERRRAQKAGVWLLERRPRAKQSGDGGGNQQQQRSAIVRAARVTGSAAAIQPMRRRGGRRLGAVRRRDFRAGHGFNPAGSGRGGQADTSNVAGSTVALRRRSGRRGRLSQIRLFGGGNIRPPRSACSAFTEQRGRLVSSASAIR